MLQGYVGVFLEPKYALNIGICVVCPIILGLPPGIIRKYIWSGPIYCISRFLFQLTTRSTTIMEVENETSGRLSF